MEVFVKNTKKLYCFFFSYLSGKAEERSVRRSARKQATRAFQMEPNEVRKFGAREFRFASMRESYQ